jgi:hypothetical protein
MPELAAYFSRATSEMAHQQAGALPREQVTFAGKATAWMRTAWLPFLDTHRTLSALIQTEKFARYSKECGAMIGSAFHQGGVFRHCKDLFRTQLTLRGSPIFYC